MRGMRVAFVGAVVVAVAALGGAVVACVGDDATPPGDVGGPDASGDGNASGDGASGDGASDGGADAAPLYTCGLQNNPPEILVATVSKDGGGGTPVDGERFTMVPIDAQYVAIVGMLNQPGVPAGDVGPLAIWTVDTTKGSPGPQQAALVNLTGGTNQARILWAGRGQSGVAVLVFTGDGYYMAEFSEVDLLAGNMTAPSLVTVKAPMVTANTKAEGAAAISLGASDYFLVATNTPSAGTTGILVSARTPSAPHAARAKARWASPLDRYFDFTRIIV